MFKEVNATKLRPVTRGITPQFVSGRFPELLKMTLNLALFFKEVTE